MSSSNRSSNPSHRAAAVALILILATLCFGQAARRPPQSEPVKKTQPAASETPRNKEEQHDERDQAIKLEATLVTVPVIASDRDGRYIPDMRREDFTLHEDGVKQEIVFFGTVNEPVHVVLMLDTSASTQEKLDQIKRAATTFVEQLKPADRVKVISFDDAVHDLCEFTNDRAELGRAIDQTRPGKGTKLYDAVALALREMRQVQGRKAIVLFTDGADMTSDSARYEDNISAVEESGVIVYPIRYDTRAETEAMLRSQGGLGGIIKRPPVGTTPTTVPGGDGVPQLPPIGGPTTRDPRIPPVGPPPVGFPYPRSTPYPGGRPPDNRMPDDRYPQDNRIPDSRYPQDNRIPDGRNSDPRYPRRDDGLSAELDAAYRLADRYLNDLAAKSGGNLSRADTLYSLPAAFAQIAAELRTQYALGYYPSNTARDGGYRKIQVRTKRRSVMLRARPGYRAPSAS
jgi:Mg-chelatase subunit ChlD